MPKKKSRSDSRQKKTELMAQAINGIKPPAHLNLRPRDLPFWAAIIDARATWTDVDLSHAANLARCQSDIEFLQNEISEQGNTLKNERGTEVSNPRHVLLETLTRRSVALSRMLQVHAGATVGEAKLSRGKNEQKAKSLNAAKKINKDKKESLIPGMEEFKGRMH